MAKENYGGMKGGSMQEGMKKTSVPSTDKSMECKGGSVNDEAVRAGVAPTPKTLGPRTDG
jgi:hypothetical protein